MPRTARPGPIGVVSSAVRDRAVDIVKQLPALPLDWRWLAALTFGVALLLVFAVPWWIAQLQAYASFVPTYLLGVDWRIFDEASRLANPYDHSAYRWSPVALWIMTPIVALGFPGWVGLQIMVLAFLRNWWLIAAFLLAPPFWDDVLKGNSMTFVAVAGILALNGSRAGTIATFVLAMLIPRPLILPLLAFLLWKQPWSLRWFLALFVSHALLVLASGHADDYIMRLLVSGPAEMVRTDLPKLPMMEWLGTWWLPIGAILAAVLTRYGLPGLAGIAMTPYWIGNYGLILLLELRRLTSPVDLAGARSTPPPRTLPPGSRPSA